jgi:hypothetical protein
MAWSLFGLLFSIAGLRRPAPSTDLDRRLEGCPVCGRDFMSPVDWEPVGSEQWRILLRCGECETWRRVTVTNAVARRYDVELNRRAAVIAAAWERLDHERMIGEVETMTTALRLGLIDAADFAAEHSRGGSPQRQAR